MDKKEETDEEADGKQKYTTEGVKQEITVDSSEDKLPEKAEQLPSTSVEKPAPKPSTSRTPPPVPQRGIAQKPRDLPLKHAVQSEAGSRKKGQQEPSTDGRPTQKEGAKAVKIGQPSDSREASSAIARSPSKKRDTSPRFTTRKEPSPKRVTAEPKSPLAQRRADTCIRHGSSQESLKEPGRKDDKRGTKSPRDEKAASHSPGGSPKRQQQTTGTKRASHTVLESKRSDEQLKASPEKKSKSSYDAKSRSTSPRGSSGGKKKVTNIRQEEESQVSTKARQKETVPKKTVQKLSDIKGEKNTSMSVTSESVAQSSEANPKLPQQEQPKDEVEPLTNRDQSQNSASEKVMETDLTKLTTTDSGASEHENKPLLTEGEMMEPPREGQSEKTEKATTSKSIEQRITESSADSLAVNTDKTGQIMESNATTNVTVIKEKPKISSGLQNQKTRRCSETCVPSMNSDFEAIHNILTDKAALSAKEMLTLRNNAIQTYSNNDNVQSVTSRVDTQDTVALPAQTLLTDHEQCFSGELLTLERKKKDEQNTTIKGKPTEVSQSRNSSRSTTEKQFPMKSKRTHSDSVVMIQKNKHSLNSMTGEKVSNEKTHIASLEKILKEEGTTKKISSPSVPYHQMEEKYHGSVTEKATTRIQTGFQDMTERGKKIDDQLQKSNSINNNLRNDGKKVTKEKIIHTGDNDNIQGKHTVVNQGTVSREENNICDTSVANRSRIAHYNGRPQVQKLDAMSQKHTSEQKDSKLEEESPGCGGHGRTCPVYFGVKSYLHQFYDSAPARSPVYEDYMEEQDDFEYMVDPSKRRKGCCSQELWFRAGVWGGANLLLIGMIAMLIGHLTPPRQVVLESGYDLEVLDRTAIAFNHRLELCRLVGLGVFCCGGMVLLITLLVSTIRHAQREPTVPPTPLVEPFDVSPSSSKIPITEKIKQVQPNIWPSIATVREGSLVVQMP